MKGVTESKKLKTILRGINEVTEGENAVDTKGGKWKVLLRVKKEKGSWGWKMHGITERKKWKGLLRVKNERGYWVWKVEEDTDADKWRRKMQRVTVGEKWKGLLRMKEQKGQ